MKVYGFSGSGNCYKVKLLLTLLEKDYEWIEINSRTGETRTPEYLYKNPQGKVPFLELDNNRSLSESGAILFYLAKNTKYLPEDNYNQSQVLKWILFEQTAIVPYIAINRGMIIKNLKQNNLDKFSENTKNGYNSLNIIEAYLQDKNYFVNETLTIADIALFSYINVAEVGEFNMSEYKNINKWLNNVKSHPNYIKMP